MAVERTMEGMSESTMNFVRQHEWVLSFSAPCILLSQIHSRIHREKSWRLEDMISPASIRKSLSKICSFICCGHQFPPEKRSPVVPDCLPMSSIYCVSTFCCCLVGWPCPPFLIMHIWMQRYKFKELQDIRDNKVTCEKFPRRRNHFKLNCMNVVFWPVMLYELYEFIKYHELQGDLFYEWETRKVTGDNEQTALNVLNDGVVYICGSSQSGKSCLLERILSIPTVHKDNSLMNDLHRQDDNMITNNALKSSKVQTGYRAARLKNITAGGDIHFQVFHEISAENMWLMDITMNESGIPNCVIIVSDPTGEHCMKNLEHVYRLLIEKLEMKMCSDDIIETCSQLYQHFVSKAAHFL